jgi:hypothetical protein
MDHSGACAEQEPARAAGMARLLPSVSFGMRAAVLAGVVVAGAPAAAAHASASPAVTTGLSAPITQLISMHTTTCCGNGIPMG